MKTLSIIYIGCGMSGRRTSLSKVLASAGCTVDPLDISGEHRYEFIWSEGPKPLRIIASVSTARSHLYYEDLSEAGENSPVDIEACRLADADGVIFVIDSQTARSEANLWQLVRFYDDLKSKGVNAEQKPVVFQINKRDLDDVCSADWVRTCFTGNAVAYVETVATRAKGTSEAMAHIIRLVQSSQDPSWDPARE